MTADIFKRYQNLIKRNNLLKKWAYPAVEKEPNLNKKKTNKRNDDVPLDFIFFKRRKKNTVEENADIINYRNKSRVV